MYKPSSHLVVTYFPTYLPTYIWDLYFLQNWLPRWNQILTQLMFIHNWVPNKGPLFKLLLINEDGWTEDVCFFPPPTKDSGATFIESLMFMD
jgi:hypothetical protein